MIPHSLTALAIAQLNPISGDIAGNTRQILTTAQEAIANQLSCVVFPELFLFGYPSLDLLLRPSCQAACQQAIAQICAAQLPITLVVGTPLYQNSRCYNGLVVIYNGHIIATGTKKHLACSGVFDEQRVFAPGSNLPCLFTVNDTRYGAIICEDLWHPGAAERCVTHGADAIICINASPYALGKVDERLDCIKQRFHSCQKPIIYCNQVGGQDELIFDGNSLLYINEQHIHRLPHCQAGLYPVAQLTDPCPISQDHNATIGALYDVLVLAVQDYARKNQLNRLVLGVSGGIDSAVVACIAVDAVGRDCVEAVLLPSEFTSDDSCRWAKHLIDHLHIASRTLSITPAHHALCETLQGVDCPANLMEISNQNIQARVRGILLMGIANRQQALLLTTGNRSEMAVGYTTLYGDMCGGYAPLKNVLKTQVTQLAHWCNRHVERIPHDIITRPPTAELAANQLDCDHLPDYPTLDAFITQFIDQQQPPHLIKELSHDPERQQALARTIHHNEHKRWQAAPGPRIHHHCWGSDRRVPITHRLYEQ